MPNTNADGSALLGATANRVEDAVASLYVLLWSQTGNWFHVEPVSAMLGSNCKRYADDRPILCGPLYIGTMDTCLEIADSCRNTLRAREVGREQMREVIDRARLGGTVSRAQADDTEGGAA